MSDCKVFRTEIEEASDGGALGRGAASHAEGCASCGATLREREALRRLVGGLGRVEAPHDFEFRLRARMAASKPRGGHGVFARLLPAGGLAWAAVAVCLVTVTAAVYFRQAQPTERPASNSAEVASVPQANASPSAPESNNAGVLTNRQSNSEGAPVVSRSTNSGKIESFTVAKRAANRTRGKELAARETGGESTQSGSHDEAITSAPVRLPQLNAGDFVASHGQAQGIQLGASAGTLRVVLRDERGALVPMLSVSFGSQEPLSRQTAGGRLTSKDDEGVW
jgi:hypothetical protein